MVRETSTQDLFAENTPSATEAVSGDTPLEITPGTLSVGMVLRTRRTELDLTIEECHQKTRIRPVLLEALEEEDLKLLPSNRTTIRSYVRAYAGCLDLDAEELVQQFNDLHFPHVEQRVSRKPKPLPTLPTNAILFLTIALVLVILLIGLLQNFLDEPNDHLEVKVPPLPKAQQEKIQKTLLDLPEPKTVEPETPAEPVVSVAARDNSTLPVLRTLRISHPNRLWVNLLHENTVGDVHEMQLLEPAEALNIEIEVGSSLQIPNADNVMLMLIDQTNRVVAEVPYQAIADNKGWVHLKTLIQE